MKKKTIGRLAALLLVGAFVLAGVTAAVGVPSVASTDPTVQGYEDELRSLETRQQQLQELIDNAQAGIYNKTIYIQQLQELKQTVQAKIAVSKDLLASLAQRRDTLEIRIAETQAQQDETFAQYLERVRVSYEDGKVSYLELLFGASGIGDFLSRLDRVACMLDYDRRLITEYRETEKVLTSEKNELEESILRQEEVKQSLNETMQHYYELERDAEAQIAALQGNEAELKRQYQETERAWEEANAALQARLEELARETQQRLESNAFIWPLDVYSNYYLTSVFGVERWIASLNYYDPGHTGIDICGPSCFGNPIYASADGQVYFSTNYGESSYGNYIIIDHGLNANGDDIVTLYAHCNYVVVNAGDYVKQGDVIGYVGVTGRVTGAHLHFEYRINGVRQDALRYVRVPRHLVNCTGVDSSLYDWSKVNYYDY